jgi:hypothetical protein
VSWRDFLAFVLDGAATAGDSGEAAAAGGGTARAAVTDASGCVIAGAGADGAGADGAGADGAGADGAGADGGDCVATCAGAGVAAVATGAGAALGVAAVGGRDTGAVALEPGSGAALGRPSGCALGVRPSAPPRPLDATTATTMIPATTLIAATIDHRRPLRRGIVLAPAEPEMVEGERCAPLGSSAVRGAAIPTMPFVRCTEIAAWVSDCAYFAIAIASSAVFWNRLAVSFSRHR